MAVDVESRSAISSPAASRVRRTIPARDFYGPEVFELERDSFFARRWLCVGREEEIRRPGDYIARDLLGEGVLVVRDESDRVGAFYNVCRHRGTRLCDEGRGHAPKVFRCPYHAWTYGLDGRLVGTPNIPEGDGFDRSDFPLHRVPLERWEGFLFVNFSESPPPLSEQLGPNAAAFTRYRIGDLRTTRRLEFDCDANWKVIVENYNECLHCPTVHPELVELVPIYRRGLVIEDDGFEGNRLAPGVQSWTVTGTSKVPPLPGLTEEDLHTYWGFVIFPTMFVNLLPDVVTYELLWPVGPDRTHISYDFLFHPSSIERPDFDPTAIYEFRELIVRQDLRVCELAQRGARSRGYGQGVLPPQDDFVYDFERQYVRERDAPS